MSLPPPRTCLAAALLTLPLAAVPGFRPARGADFTVDAVHSTVLFRVKHMGASYAFGRFNDVSGRFSVDDSQPSRDAIDIVIKAASVDTGNEKRDQHLRGVDFFNAVQFPEIRFKSTRVSKAGSEPHVLDVEGELSLHGVTRPVVVKLYRTGSAKDMKGVPISGVYAEFTVRRSEFGMKGMVGPVADEVRVTVSLEGGLR